jgi:hypothetical protein
MQYTKMQIGEYVGNEKIKYTHGEQQITMFIRRQIYCYGM